MKQRKYVLITTSLLVFTSVCFQLTFANDFQDKNKNSKSPISIELVNDDRFVTITNSKHRGNRIGYRFFEHVPIVFGDPPKSVEETDIDINKQKKIIEDFANQNDLIIHSFNTNDTNEKNHWIDLNWTYYMDPVDDGIDILLVIETADIGLPDYYGAQQCFRMSGKTNKEWRKEIAETPAFSEYDHWASQKENEKTSLTWVRKNSKWKELPAMNECVGARTPSGVSIDGARFLGDLSQPIGPYEGIVQESIDEGLATRVNNEGTWISGIFWEKTSHITDHHPADCLHSIVNIGNIPPHSKRVIRGKIYWFEGTKDDLFRKWQNDFL